MHRILVSIHRLWGMVVHALFPKRKEEELLESLHVLPGSKLYRIAHTPFPIYSLGRYDTPLWHALVHEIKFHKNKHAVSLVAPRLKDALHEITNRNDEATPTYVVPIPLSSARARTRGFNQVTLVLDATHGEGRNAKYTIEPNLLTRVLERNEQKTLNRGKREENVAGSFVVPPHHVQMIHSAHIVLVDDVCATGATVREAGATYMHAGAASVTVVVWCNS